MELLKTLYRTWSGADARDIEPLTQAGSNRQYVRFFNRQGQSVIGVRGTSREENQAFLYLTRHFREKHLPVAEVLAVSDDGMRYLLSDLGTRSLHEQIKSRTPELPLLLERTIRLLPHIQIEGAEGLDWTVCYPKPAFDRESIFFDLNYFKYCFLKPSGADFNESRLEQDFCRLADALLQLPANAFMYRDFQSRNVMLSPDGQPLLIDYQGGRRGPLHYDLASFLWQASAGFTNEERQHLISVYYNELATLTTPPLRETFERELQLVVAFRLLQVLGAYGYRGYFERKPYFIESIPPALRNLVELLQTGVFAPYPELQQVLTELKSPEQTKPSEPTAAQENLPQPTSAGGKLTVRVNSFSFKKGIPADESGNGGGYVFDCRSTHNPGRYEPFKQLTGLDQPVVDFLERDGEILSFLDHVYPLVSHHVERFLQRGFTSLMISFGCTGGQHRSVYCAEHVGRYLHKKYGVDVIINHREQGITTQL